MKEIKKMNSWNRSKFGIDFSTAVSPLERRCPGSKRVGSKQNMSFGHSEVSFNHSCLKVPVDSLSRRPAPRYERVSSAKNSHKEKQDKREFPLSDCTNFTSVKKYLEFYESIPDYSELHHLSNEEFYSRLKSLKITQKRLCSESGIWSSVNSEDDIPNGKFSFDCVGSPDKGRKAKGNKSEIEFCGCSLCSPDKDYCGRDEFYKKTNSKASDSFGGVKQPPPKINIISDNENASDLYESEFKKHSDYEADQESSTLQVGEKRVDGLRNSNVDDECLLGNCTRRSRSLPASPACECESPGMWHGCCDLTFRNECRHSCYSASKKDRQSSTTESKMLHSRPIPLTSRIPLFDKIMMEKEARRKAMHDLYSEELRSLVKPFSFTKREEEKERLRMISSNPELTASLNPPLVRFKAKPIPKNLFSNYAYERMKEDEFYRALKRKVRAEELLKSSSLPPSMALREKKFRSRSLDFLDYRCPKRSWNKACGYRRACKNIKREIEFDEKAKTGSPQKRKNRSGWIYSRRVNSATDSSTEISPYESILNPERRRKGRPHSAFSCSRNNLASVLRIETARKRLEKEMEEKLRENRLKDHAKYKAHLTRMSPAWRALRYDKNEDLAVRVAARRREEQMKKEDHQRLMDSIYGRVYNMPPLFHKERFFNGKNTRLHSCTSEKDLNGFRYNEKPEERLAETEKDFSTTFDKEQNCRSRQSSESAATCDKNEKTKPYESDDGTNET